MDDTFDHEDPNNRPEEIPMDDLDNYDEDNDEYFDVYDLEMMETIFSGGNDQNILADDIDINYNDQELQRRELVLQRKVETVKSAILDVTRKQWNARLDSSNTRDLLNNISIKGDRESVWYKGKIVYKRVGGKYELSTDKRSMRYILEFRQQLKNLDHDFNEWISSDRQKIDQLITTNTIWKNGLTNFPVEIATRLTLKGTSDNALNLNPENVESPETVVNEVENTIFDIKKERDKTSDPDTRKYYTRLIDYLENNVDILRLRQGLTIKYNNLDETDYGRLRRFKHFLRRNFGIIAFTNTVVGGLAGLVITIVSFVRSSTQSAAKGASNASKKTWDFVKKVGAVLARILTVLATVLSWSASALLWLSISEFMVFVNSTCWNHLQYFKRFKYI